MNIKNLLKQHILTILSILALVALFLPFFNINSEVNSSLIDYSESTKLTGFDAIGEAVLGWGLVIGPIVLIAMNYIKQLEKHKGLLAIIVPIICLIVEVITFF